MKRIDEMTITEFAREIEVHPNTVRRWVWDAVAGRPSKLQDVRVDYVGRYFIKRNEVDRFRSLRSEFF